jgi:hypothetical protein
MHLIDINNLLYHSADNPEDLAAAWRLDELARHPV